MGTIAPMKQIAPTRNIAIGKTPSVTDTPSAPASCASAPTLKTSQYVMTSVAGAKQAVQSSIFDLRLSILSIRVYPCSSVESSCL